MNLYLRLLLAWIKGCFQSVIPPMQSDTVSHRVMPWDIDLFGHMNNGRYLQICDVSRVSWMRRAGILQVILKNRWSAVLGGTLVRYCKALKPWQSYQVVCRLLCWDQRWFFIEHRFINRRGEEVAVCVTRAALRDKAGWVATQHVVDQVQPGLQSPIPCLLVSQWMQTDAMLVCTPLPHSNKATAATAATSLSTKRKQA